jgi:chemotaxis signal transduction protein
MTAAFFLFKAEQSHWAVPLVAVVQVLDHEPLVPVPLPPPGIRGLRFHRGQVVPVAGLPPGGQAPEGTQQSDRPVLLVKSSRGLWGIEIDRHGTEVAPSCSIAAPSSTPEHRGVRLTGVIHHGSVRYLTLDLDGTWAAIRQQVETHFQELGHSARIVAAERSPGHGPESRVEHP